MSELWAAETTDAVTRVPIWVRNGAVERFVPWSANMLNEAVNDFGFSSADHDPSPVMNATDMRAAAFAEGFEEGRLACEAVLAEERLALVHLAASLEVLKPQPSQELGLLLAETVDRLVRQIVGEVTIDRDTLVERANAAAEIVSDQAGTMRLRLHPDDIERLDGANIDIPFAPDTHLTQGTLLLETGDGWIEDSPEVRLDRLRTALDRMGTTK